VNPRRQHQAVPREAEVQREIELALGAEPDLLLMRNANGVARYVDDDGRERFTRMGLPNGAPDLVGIHAPFGRWFGLECKARDGRLSPDQRRIHDLWRRSGAFVAVARSAHDARLALEQARKESLAMPYLIDRLTFPRRRDVAAHCGAILRRGAITRDEEHFVRELLKGHPGYARIVGAGPHRITVGTSSFGDPCFVVQRSDGRREEFSFVTCITAKFEVGTTPEAA